MKKLALILPVLTAVFAVPVSAGNIANCEVVLMEPMIKDGKDTGAKFASFRPAAAFLSSVYDDEAGHETQLDDHDIRGVMCTRQALIPTLRDFPILATGIPFSVSENFDSPNSNLMTLYFKDGKFHHTYAGAKLNPGDLEKLKDVMEVFNLQPHELGETDTKENEIEDMESQE